LKEAELKKLLNDSFLQRMPLSPGDKVISLDPSKNQEITGNGHRYSARVIIGADSAPSRLQRLLTAGGYIKNRKKSGLATALELVLSSDLAPALPDYPVIYFGHIRWGYAWCFPRKNSRILGICGLNEKSGKYLKLGTKLFKNKKMPVVIYRIIKTGIKLLDSIMPCS